MGIPVEGPTCIYGDNQSVLANTTIPDSTEYLLGDVVATCTDIWMDL